VFSVGADPRLFNENYRLESEIRVSQEMAVE
jgi:hypothetical protein